VSHPLKIDRGIIDTNRGNDLSGLPLHLVPLRTNGSEIEPLHVLRNGVGFIIFGRAPMNMSIEQVLAELVKVLPSGSTDQSSRASEQHERA
jgi:hypothetical protein